MSAPVPPAPPAPPRDPDRSAQVALGVLLAVALAAVAFRGYGSRLGATPTDHTPTRPDLNTADPAELRQVPGVGPKLAARVAADRDANGPFRSPADLARVPGVGPRTLAKLAPLVAAGGVTADDPLPPPRPVYPRGPAKRQPGDPPLDVNTCDEAELQTLPGVGPVTARAIVAARPYITIDDLRRARGVGPKTLEKVRPFVTVGDR